MCCSFLFCMKPIFGAGEPYCAVRAYGRIHIGMTAGADADWPGGLAIFIFRDDGLTAGTFKKGTVTADSPFKVFTTYSRTQRGRRFFSCGWKG